MWVTSEANNPNRRRAVLTTQLIPRPTNGYDTTTVPELEGRVQNGILFKLDPSEYTVNARAGYITLNSPPQVGKDAVAVAYTVNNGSQ